MAIDPSFLEMLCCPEPGCRADLVLQGEDRLRCTGCGRAYPIRDGFPILLLEEAILDPRNVPGEPGAPAR